jgi:hypothetical protein
MPGTAAATACTSARRTRCATASGAITLGQGRALSSSAFRRNVAAHLGFGSAAAIKAGDMVLTETQLNEVRQWIMGCEVAWLTCATAADAVALETSLKREFKPPLTKR